MSVVLTVVSLGTRVALAYALSAIPALGVVGIWWSVPIGWLLADRAGDRVFCGKKKEDFWHDIDCIIMCHIRKYSHEKNIRSKNTAILFYFSML